MASPLHLFRSVAIVSSSVDNALVAGVWEGFCEIPAGCSLHKHGTAPTPGVAIDLDLISRFAPARPHLGNE